MRYISKAALDQMRVGGAALMGQLEAARQQSQRESRESDTITAIDALDILRSVYHNLNQIEVLIKDLP